MAWKEFAFVWLSSAINGTSHGRWFANFMDFVVERSSAAPSLATFKSRVQKGSHARGVRSAFFFGLVLFIPGATYLFPESIKSLPSSLPLFLYISRLKKQLVGVTVDHSKDSSRRANDRRIRSNKRIVRFSLLI